MGNFAELLVKILETLNCCLVQFGYLVKTLFWKLVVFFLFTIRKLHSWIPN